MKQLILLLGIVICLTAAHVVLGQQEGTIHYEMKVNLHRTLPGDRPEMKDMIPEFNIHKNKLVFSGAESLYVNVDGQEEEEFGDEDGPVQVRMRTPMNEYYFNFIASKRVAMQEFFGKYFLIEDSVKATPWKFADGSKTILGYDCKRATFFIEERKQSVTAWYTEKLPSFLGPETFNSLPGTILQIDINEGERVITATKISLDKPAKGELKAPTKGQKTTEEDFRKMVDEQHRRMGGNGNIMIRN
jgi:GLPGLI family protein